MNPASTSTEPISRPTLRRRKQSQGNLKRKHVEYVKKLQELYNRILEQNPNDSYIRSHSQINSIRRNVDLFLEFQDYIPENATVLDWGCKHAPNSALCRFAFGADVELFGCDFDRGDSHKPFHDFAQLKFSPIEHVYKLPYEDETFDVIIAGGVLEHVAFPCDSLRELYRILKPHGILIITFLPNHYSYTEFLSRHLRGRGHRRLYTPQMLRLLLLHHGFEPAFVRYRQMIPAQRLPRLLSSFWMLNPVLERTWPLSVFSSTLFSIAIKRIAL